MLGTALGSGALKMSMMLLLWGDHHFTGKVVSSCGRLERTPGPSQRSVPAAMK